MPEPYELMMVADNTDDAYLMMLSKIGTPDGWIINYKGVSRFALINRALDLCKGTYYMHLENDFYWENQNCLKSAISTLQKHDDIDFVRFEQLPFNENIFSEYRQTPFNKLGIMKSDAPYQFTFNPHLRRNKFPCGRFQETDFTKQPEQHHNDNYQGTSACLFGNNFRHLGIYDEGGHYKPWYAERFTLRRGERTIERPLYEFDQFCSNYRYRQLFMRYLYDHRK
jgi:hypothetical protein